MNNNVKNLCQEHAFCRFVAQVYSQADLQEGLEHFCSGFNINQNILLFCCWYPSQGAGLLSKKDLREIIREVIPWHSNVVLSLENFLMKIKTKIASPETRMILQEVKSNLLLANCYEQLIIANYMKKNFAEPKPDRFLSDAAKNISAYCRELSVIVGMNEKFFIDKLLTIIYP